MPSPRKFEGVEKGIGWQGFIFVHEKLRAQKNWAPQWTTTCSPPGRKTTNKTGESLCAAIQLQTAGFKAVGLALRAQANQSCSFGRPSKIGSLSTDPNNANFARSSRSTKRRCSAKRLAKKGGQPLKPRCLPSAVEVRWAASKSFFRSAPSRLNPSASFPAMKGPTPRPPDSIKEMYGKAMPVFCPRARKVSPRRSRTSFSVIPNFDFCVAVICYSENNIAGTACQASDNRRPRNRAGSGVSSCSNRCRQV